MPRHHHSSFLFFFNDTATTEIYTLSLHDALPICKRWLGSCDVPDLELFPQRYPTVRTVSFQAGFADRKSTRLNSSHLVISYAVFCLKKKKTRNIITSAKLHFTLTSPSTLPHTHSP